MATFFFNNARVLWNGQEFPVEDVTIHDHVLGDEEADSALTSLVNDEFPYHRSDVKLSDCPHRPGTQAWKVWQQRYITWQYTQPKFTEERERHRAALRRLNEAAYDPNVAATDAIMREVKEAKRLGDTTGTSEASPLIATGLARALIGYDLTLERQKTEEAIARIAAAFGIVAEIVRDATDKILVTFKDFIEKNTDVPVRTLQVKGIERPAGRVHRCHHGNPKGCCRECSMSHSQGHRRR